MKFHREGRLIIPGSFLLFGGISFLAWYFLHDTKLEILAWPVILFSVIMAGLILNFFRNPDRQFTRGENLVISPCDGKVVVIEEVEEPVYFKGKRIQLSIFMSPLNVHVNRNPIGGKIVYQQYFPGKYLMAFNPKSSTENEMNYVVISDGKREVGFKQIAGFLARRICWYVKAGDSAEQCGEMGFIRFGSRIDVFLPVGTKINVKLDEVVWGGQTRLAELIG